MEKGTKVCIIEGKARGQEGEVFWSGPSKYGNGLRLGIKTDDGEKIWVNSGDVEQVGGSAEGGPTFINFEPEDWDESLHFEVRFSTPPSDDVLRWLGQRWDNWWVPIERESWLFYKDFAAFDFFPKEGREEDAIAETEQLLREVHAQAAIVEASFGSLPSSSLVEASEHPSFEEGARGSRDEQVSAEVTKVLSEAAKHHVKLDLVQEPVLPERSDYPEGARGWLPTTVEATIKGSLTAPFIWLEEFYEGSLPPPKDELVLPEGLKYKKPAKIVPRGDRALVALDEIEPGKILQFGNSLPPVLCLATPDAITPIMRCTDNDVGYYNYVWLDDDHICASTSKRTVVISLSKGKEVAKARGGNYHLAVSKKGRLIVGDSKVFLWLSGKLVLAAQNKHDDLAPYHWDEDRVVLRLYNRDGPDAFFELTGVEEAFVALEPKKKKAKPKKS